MTRIFIGSMICFFLLNCDKKEKKIVVKNKSYIISYEDRKFLQILKKGNISLPINGFYGENQLIIDKNGNLFFYQKEYIRAGCGTRSENDTLPHFFNLQPKDIIRIPKACVNNFLSENILDKEEYRRILIIASQNDTIKNTSFFNFVNKNKLRAYLIRRTTQEEDTVLKYKKNNDSYYSEDIKWDKNRIQLPFVKPKLDH